MAPEEQALDQLIKALNDGIGGDTFENHLRSFDPDNFCDPCQFSLYDYREPTFSKKCFGLVFSGPIAPLLDDIGRVIANYSIDVLIHWKYLDSKSSRNNRKAMRYRAALSKFLSKYDEKILSQSDISIGELGIFGVQDKAGSEYLVTGVTLKTNLNFTRVDT